MNYFIMRIVLLCVCARMFVYGGVRVIRHTKHVVTHEFLRVFGMCRPCTFTC